MKFTIITTFCFFVLSGDVSAQNTPEDLGKRVFKVFQMEQIDSFDLLFPSAEQLIKIAVSMGLTQSEDKIAEFKKLLLKRRSIFKQQCKEILVEGNNQGIKWSDAILVDVIKKTDTISVSLEPKKDYFLTLVRIHFSYKYEKYLLVLGEVYHYNQLWMLGEKVEFERESQSNNE